MRALTIVLASLPSILFAHVAFAACATPGEYEIMAPFATLSGCVDLTGYLNRLMQTLIGIAGILAVIMIVICGIRLMTSGSAGGKSEAKECITNAILGVLLAAGSWIILNTINPFLLKDAPLSMPSVSTAIPPPPPGGPPVEPFPTNPGWYFRYRDPNTGNTRNSPSYDTQEACAAALRAQQDGGVTIQNNPPSGTPNTVGANGTANCWKVLAASEPLDASEAAVRNALCGNNSCVNSTPIGINAPPCQRDGDPGRCTNVKGLAGSAVTAIRNLSTACGCNVMVTGGTEYWKHSRAGTGSHAPGNAVFDLRWDGDSTSLANTIKSGGNSKPSFAGNTRWLYNGFWYTDEKSAELHGGRRHWHVCPVGASPAYCN